MVEADTVKQRGKSHCPDKARQGGIPARLHSSRHGGLAMKRHVTTAVTAKGNPLLGKALSGEMVPDSVCRLLRAEVDAEMPDFQAKEKRRGTQDRQQAVRDSRHPERTIVAHASPVSVRVPKGHLGGYKATFPLVLPLPHVQCFPQRVARSRPPTWWGFHNATSRELWSP